MKILGTYSEVPKHKSHKCELLCVNINTINTLYFIFINQF